MHVLQHTLISTMCTTYHLKDTAKTRCEDSSLSAAMGGSLYQ